MSFGNTLWLYILPAVIAGLVLFFLWSERRTHARLEAFASSKLAASLTANFSLTRQRIKMGLIITASALLCLALAQPRHGVVLEESEARGIDLMIALDTSRSMLAEDVRPNRLERAKLAVLDLVDGMRGDRVGLIAFAGDAFLQCPLTLDYDAFRATLDAVDTDTITRGGTDLSIAIEEASAALSDNRNFKLLVLLTDGEDLEASGIVAARAAAENGLRIFTVGIGSGEGELIPIRDAQGNLNYLRDASGNLVRSSLDETTLQEIASVSGGFYASLGSGGGLQALYEQLIAELPAEELGTRMQEIPLERYQWPLTIALALLFLEPLVGTRRRRPTGPLASLPVLALFLFLVAPIGELSASPVRAVKLYERGEYEQAVGELQKALEENPFDARLRYNLGNALYKLERWNEARSAFRSALETSDPKLQADAFFNLGNTFFQEGGSQPETMEGRRNRLALWENALDAYGNSRALDAERPDIARNVDIVSGAIDDLTSVLTVVPEPTAGGEAGPSGRFVREAPVEVSAKPQEGWIFRRWSGADVTEPESEQTTIHLVEDAILTAHFVKTWKLDVVSAQTERGTAGESGIYPEDEPVTISAKANEGYVFDRWTSEEATIEPANEPEAQVTLTQDATVTATFVDAFHLEVESEPRLGGFAGDTGWYAVDTAVPIHAEPRAGFSWVGWQGTGIDDVSAPETAIHLTDHRQVVAKFNREWNLIVLPNDPEGGTVTGGGDFPLGTLNPVTAIPGEGYRFEHWEGPGVLDATAAETSVRVESEEHDVIAVFVPEDDSQDDQDDSQDDQDDSQDDQDSQDDSQDESEGADDAEDSSEGESRDGEDGEETPEGEQPEGTEDEASPPEESDEEAPPSEPEEGEGAPEEPAEEDTSPADPALEEAGNEASSPIAEPGEMTQEEARQLLNALRESEQKLPAVRTHLNEDTSTGRDW